MVSFFFTHVVALQDTILERWLFKNPIPNTPVLHAQQVVHVCVLQEEHLLVPAIAPVVMAKVNISAEGTAYLAILVRIHGGRRNLISRIFALT